MGSRAKRILFSMLLIVGTTPLASQAQEGKALYQTCGTCHGDLAQGNSALLAPALAGQSVDYLVRQLAHFANGTRGAHPDDSAGATMVPMARLVDEAQRKVISTYLSALSPPPQTQDTPGDIKNGARYYQAKCGACHGGGAEGNPAFKAPRLAGLSTNYIQRQMHNFRSGLRGTAKDDKPGRQMAAMAKSTSDEVLTDILHFIALQGKPQ